MISRTPRPAHPDSFIGQMSKSTLDRWAINCAMLQRRLRLRSPKEKAKFDKELKKALRRGRAFHRAILEGRVIVEPPPKLGKLVILPNIQPSDGSQV